MIISNVETAAVNFLRERVLSVVVSVFLPMFFIGEAVLWLGLVKILAPFVLACIGTTPFSFYRSGRSGAARNRDSGRRNGKARVRGLYLDAPSYEDASTRQRENRNTNIVGTYRADDDTEIDNNSVLGLTVKQTGSDERATSHAADDAVVGMMPPILEGDFTLGLVLLAPVGTPEIAQ